MSSLARMSDEELLRRTAEARKAAHDAPKRITGAGEPGISGHGCFDRANDWMQLATEVNRRGLKQPDAT